jgi:hypothetical protein
MILGRNTQQWLGLITAAAATIQTLVVVLLPEIDAGTVAVIIGAVVGFLGVLIAFIANNYTTPVADPQLKAGTMVRVTDEGGTVIGHEPVATPPAT